ncbi:MAG TPA: acyltransferase family protein [Propionibacteriaceae bacterium]|nr:acyltransferase family protein [Propionibacteriaceae bacterium]
MVLDERPGGTVRTLQPKTPAVAVRLVDIDWLRVLAMLAIFVYHSARLFDTMEPWHVKSRERLEWLTYPMAAGSQFVMPLFWVLSGISTYFALGAHPAGTFVRRRLARLLVPVVTVGWLVLSPVQVYIESTTGQGYNAPPFRGTFWQFLPHYVTDGLYGFGGYFVWNALHLWYLVYLLLFSLASVPVFLWVRGPGSAPTRRLTGFLSRPAAVHLLALPAVLPEVFLPRSIPLLGWGEGGWRTGSFWVLLLLGYLIATDMRLRRTLERQRWVSLALATATLVPLGLLAAGMGSLAFGSPDFVWQMTLRTVNGWFCVAAVLGFGTRHLTRPTRLLAYAGPAVLPFYILHQPVIVVVGYVIRDWRLPALAEYALVMAVVLSTCLLAYEYVIRRHPVMRVLFGLPAHPPRPEIPA